MKQRTRHEEQLQYLKKIEGQVRGIQRMISERQYCIDIITQIHSAIGALHRVENEIFKKHIDGCVVSALKGRSALKTRDKIEEIVGLIERFRKAG
jgi:DNA-binding FrmR family transcriptional regulator